MKKRHFLGMAALLPRWPVFAQEIPHQVWSQARALRGIPTQSGMTNPSLYVFFDPNCPYCAQLWSIPIDGKPFHDLPSVWIPVAYLSKSSLDKSAACLRGGRKEDLQLNFSKYDRQQRLGGIPGVQATRAERSALNSAEALWITLGGATPMLLYRTRQGDAKVFMGLTSESDMTALVHKMALPNRSM
ncbi:hypothetical protein [Verminephrobacter aporrectodeae]|uniref:hypothetical protein n=1 Tax=Verminephrobacter aporrectodeae TaxID=1110389 RepID=UPI002242DC9E|nr:hypothetical protein [Verminephrobacter aporrectodeae]